MTLLASSRTFEKAGGSCSRCSPRVRAASWCWLSWRNRSQHVRCCRTFRCFTSRWHVAVCGLHWPKTITTYTDLLMTSLAAS